MSNGIMRVSGRTPAVASTQDTGTDKTPAVSCSQDTETDNETEEECKIRCAIRRKGEIEAQHASSAASVAESAKFTETNPEALRGLGLGIDENDKEAPGDAVMNDAESESEGGEILTLEQEPVSGGASISTSRMQVLNMRVYDVLLHLLSSPRNRVCRF